MTQMNSAAKWLILLEHTESEKSVIEDIKSLGIKIAYVGKSEIISRLCDQTFKYDTISEIEELVEIEIENLRALSPIGVIGFMENTKQAELRLLKELNVEINDSVVYSVLRDKLRLRQALENLPMDQIPYFFIPDSNEELKAPLEFPFIVKPNFGYSSGGVQIVRSQDEFVQAVKTIRRLNRIIFGRETTSILGAICEEYVDGTEYSVDSITIQGRTKSVFGCIRRFPSENNFSDFMYISPFENYGQILSKAEEIIGALIRDIGLHSGPTHAEFRWCKKRNCLFLIEVAFRVGGVGSIGRLCFETTGIELNKLAIRSLTKQLELCELEGISSKSRLYGVSLNPEIGSGGRIREIRGKDFLNEDRSVVDYHLNKSIGDYVVPYPRGVDSLGEILVVAVTAEHLDKKIDEFLHKFKVIYETE